MKLLANTLICSVIAFTATTSFAQEGSKKSETMPKEEMMKKRMATEDCKAHMTSMKRDGVMKDARAASYPPRAFEGSRHCEI